MSSSRSSARPRPSRKAPKRSSPAVRAAWLDDDEIDYGPATDAVRSLAMWALEIAERDVEDWPTAREQVRNTRRFVIGRLSGQERRVPIDDIIFTAGLLARIFDADLGLELVDVLTIFDALDFPTEDLPVPPTPRGPATARNAPPKSARRAAPVPPPLRLCDECGYVHEPGMHVGYRNAA